MTFYVEYEDAAKRRLSGNVLAVLSDDTFLSAGRRCVSAIGALFDSPDSAVCGTSVALWYLRTRCRRTTKAKAAQVHPRLIKHLRTCGLL